MTTSFTATFLAQIQKELLATQTRLEEDLAQLKQSPNAVGDMDVMPQYGNEEEDNAREVADFTANKQLEITLQSELRDVEKSLQRLEEGTYGICKYCGKEIDSKRLLARPTSSSCVQCKKTLTQEA